MPRTPASVFTKIITRMVRTRKASMASTRRAATSCASVAIRPSAWCGVAPLATVSVCCDAEFIQPPVKHKNADAAPGAGCDRPPKNSAGLQFGAQAEVVLPAVGVRRDRLVLVLAVVAQRGVVQVQHIEGQRQMVVDLVVHRRVEIAGAGHQLREAVVQEI